MNYRLGYCDAEKRETDSIIITIGENDFLLQEVNGKISINKSSTTGIPTMSVTPMSGNVIRIS